MTKLDSKSVLTAGVMKMPFVGLGTYRIAPEEIDTALNAAIDAGYRHIDTAFAYKNESAIGTTLKKLFDSGKITREELFIVTKLPNIGNRYEDVETFLKKSLEALQLDYVDLYLIHGPMGFQNKGVDQLFPVDEKGDLLLDKTTNILELWKGMEAQVEAGRAKSIGISNFNQNQLKRILDSCHIPPANLQIELHIYLQQKELVSFCKRNGVTICAYAPIGSPGARPFLENQGHPTDGLVVLSPLEDPLIKEIAERHKKQPSHILLRYLIEYGVAVIPKSTNPERMKQNFDVFDFDLTKEEFEKISALDRGEEGRMFSPRSGPLMKLIASHPEYPFPK